MRVNGGVHEPARGLNETRSNVAKTVASQEVKRDDAAPYHLPELDKGRAPRFDISWLAANKDSHGIAWPPERYNPVLPAVDVAVVHEPGLRPALLVDGELVDPVNFVGTTTHHDLGVSVTVWENVSISQGDSMIEARLLDLDGNTVGDHEMPIHFSGAPARAKLIAESSHLVADGIHSPVLAVQLFDRAGYPARAGTTGEFQVEPPYQPLDQAKQLESVENKFNNTRYQVLKDGIAYIQLEPTTETGEAVLRFEFDQVRSDEVRGRLTPGMRDWIMVGLVEGSYAANDLSGNLRSLEEAGLADESLTDGRAAFYAQGAIKGEWLLAAAYDTDKAFERELRQQIDPNQFYSLYGDGTEQRYGAQSQQKLYLKLERDRFVGLFGDFDTAFSRSELSKYERRMNGVNVGYFGEHLEVKAFAADTDQAFVKDQFQGDGTSGVYRLSNERLVRNSEAVRLITYDRFQTEVVLEEITLSRYLDYTIDYDRGRLIFKQPIFSQDENFNPIFIEVEYEVAREGVDEEIVGGVRAAYRIDQQDSEVALTYISDATQGQGGDLVGADFTWQMSARHKLTVEAAQTDTDLAGQADAYLLELEHRSERLAARTYLREQEQDFGLGHQALLEAGTRKIGVEGEYRLRDDVLLRGQSFLQKLLNTGTERLVTNATGQWHRDTLRLEAGLQTVQEDNAAGESLDATPDPARCIADVSTQQTAPTRQCGDRCVERRQHRLSIARYPRRRVRGRQGRYADHRTGVDLG